MKKNYIKNNIDNKDNNRQKGFTLAELIIVIAIVSIISTISMFSGGKLNSSILLSNTAYEISLIIRDAQISGLGSKLLLSGGVATTSNQGVYFDLFESDKIVFFADLNKNNKYDLLDLEENQIYNIENKRAGRITKICKIRSVAGSGDVCDEIDNLSIIFKRPNPESYFYTTPSLSPIEEHHGSVAINLGFENDICRTIVVYKTGAIQIDQSFCPPVN